MDSEMGVTTCPNCSHQGKHKLNWPDDAYYSTLFRGQLLWAWTHSHTQILKSFVESDDRDPKNYPGYLTFLLHIPTIFLLAKNRTAVSKQLQKMLAL